MKSRNDWLTIAGIGLLAMCIVTTDHEAIGHGSACLLLGGHIALLSSSIFRCSLQSGWIPPAGPFANLAGGTLALLLLRFVPARHAGARLFLIAITAFSYFWEGSYAAYAMIRRNGDLYFFLQFLTGEPALWQRCAMAACGIVLYVAAARLTSRAFLGLWPDPAIARRCARTVWFSAALGAGFAALAYAGHGWGDLKDAVLEIGVASLALLFVPRRGAGDAAQPGAVIARSYPIMILALAGFAIFVITLGHGIGAGL